MEITKISFYFVAERLLTLYSGLAFAPLAVLGGLWANPFFQTTHDMTLIESSLLVSCMFLGFGLGSPFLGWISDKKRNHLSVMKLGVIISVLSLSFIIYDGGLNTYMLAILMFIFGFFTGLLWLGLLSEKKLILYCLLQP